MSFLLFFLTFAIFDALRAQIGKNGFFSFVMNELKFDR